MAIIVKINLKALFEKKNKLLGKWWQFKVITKGSGWVERRDEIGKCSMFSRWLESFTENVTESFSSIIFLWAPANICADSNAHHRSTHRHLVEFSWQISMRKNQFHHSFRRRGLLQAKERWKMSLKYDRINVKSKNHKSFESLIYLLRFPLSWSFSFPFVYSKILFHSRIRKIKLFLCSLQQCWESKKPLQALCKQIGAELGSYQE